MSIGNTAHALQSFVSFRWRIAPRAGGGAELTSDDLALLDTGAWPAADAPA